MNKAKNEQGQGDIRSQNVGSPKLEKEYFQCRATMASDFAGEAIATLTFHLIVVGWLFIHVLLGYNTLITNGDSADQSFMWLSKVFSATQQGQVALWDFTTQSGVSFIGELQTSPLYPPAWLFGLLVRVGDPHGVDLFLIFHYLIAALGFHVLCRTLGLSWLASLMGAVIFAYGSTVALRSMGQPNLFASLAWLPWIVGASQWALRASSTWVGSAFACLCGGFIALSFLAGHVHGTIIALLTVGLLSPCAIAPGFAWEPARLWYLCRRSIIFGAIAIGLALALGLPQLAAAREYLELAYKWYGPSYTAYPHIVPYTVFVEGSLHLGDLSSLITGQQVSAIDGGSLYITWTGEICAIAALILLVPGIWKSDLKIIVICCVATIGIALSFGFSEFRPLGWLYYHCPLINMIRTPARGLFLFAVGGALLGAVGLTAIEQVLQKTTSVPLWIGWCVAAVLVMLCLTEIKIWLPPGTEHPLTGPDVQVDNILDGPVVRDLLARSRSGPEVYRFFGDRANVPPNIGNLFPILSSHGYRSSRTVIYHEYFDFDPTSPRMDRLGVRWWVSDKPVASLPVLARVGNIVIQERPAALPVFWLADGTSRGTAVPIDRIVWEQNNVEVTFPTPISGKLVFAQTIYPGWAATADGLPVRVKEFEQLLAIDLPGPTRQVQFRYDPAWWRPALWICGLGTAFLAWAVIFLSFRVILPNERFDEGRAVG